MEPKEKETYQVIWTIYWSIQMCQCKWSAWWGEKKSRRRKPGWHLRDARTVHCAARRFMSNIGHDMFWPAIQTSTPIHPLRSKTPSQLDWSERTRTRWHHLTLAACTTLDWHLTYVTLYYFCPHPSSRHITDIYWPTFKVKFVPELQSQRPSLLLVPPTGTCKCSF